ncbi:MAG TPA: type II secretion system minor pseudopilin GspI [Rhodocyclaceae bacterium]|nr:type II secretion system minor pseudopilin GspI [Rhodocyclaceae bacterium]
MRIRPSIHAVGFTLLEVLVALVIVGVALGASLRAMGSLTQNSDSLRINMMAVWSAENQLAQIRLSHAWPAIGSNSVECPQNALQLVCETHTSATPNPNFRRVAVQVYDAANPQQRIVELTLWVPHVH